jgi:hypothetical protein
MSNNDANDEKYGNIEGKEKDLEIDPGIEKEIIFN